MISVPKNVKIIEGISDGEALINKYKELYKKGVSVLNSYNKLDLEKHVSFFNRKYTGMGFLWIIFGHHSYHLGQIDMIMRQNNINPTEYMEWENDKTVII